MIQPEFLSDLHQAFEHFRKVTSGTYFLRSKELVPPRWPWVLLLAAWLATIWIAHFFFPPSVVHQRVVFLLYGMLAGMIAAIPLLVIGVLFRSRWIKKRLKDEGIVVTVLHWFGPEVQLLIVKEFTSYLADKGLYNPEALSQLIENTRDEIEARWRPSALVLTLITLAVAFSIGYFQPVFSQWIVGTANEDVAGLARIGVVAVLITLLLSIVLYPYLSWFVFPIGATYLSLGSERAIYMHCLSDIRLSLLKRDKAARSTHRVASRFLRRKIICLIMTITTSNAWHQSATSDNQLATHGGTFRQSGRN